MKINEVEALAGITKKNIRFYEDQGLLCPRRNAENGYRDYGEEDVKVLLRIRLLRKLGLPIEEIRQMLQGVQTVGDGMRRHMISLEREKRNLEQSIDLCRELQTLDIPLTSLDAQGLLERMERMEQDGTAFRNRQVQDVRVQYTAPVIVTVIMVALMTALSALMLWAYMKDPENAYRRHRKAGPSVYRLRQESHGSQGSVLRRHRRHRQDGPGQDRRYPV